MISGAVSMSNFPTSLISGPTDYYFVCGISGCGSLCSEIYSNYFKIEVTICTPSLASIQSSFTVVSSK